MFSSRIPALLPNRLTRAVDAMKASARPYIDLTLSNPTRAGIAYPDDLLATLGDRRGLVYAPVPFGLMDARRAVAREYARQGVAVAAERIVLTASTSEAYSLLFKLLANAGDEVLVPRPSYPLFDYLARLDLVTAVPYDLEYHGSWSIDVDGLERAITSRTRAILIVSPNNPTGSFVTPTELDRLAMIGAASNIAIIADEVFADYELEPGASARAGRAAGCRNALTFALGGLSKSAGLPQVKVGWIAVAGPDVEVDAALQRLELLCDTYLSVSTPAQIATAELLQSDGVTAIRDQIARRVRRNYHALSAAVASAASCDVLRADGGWYAVLQVPSYESEEDLVLRLLADASVLIHPGFFFDFPRESFLIISLLTEEAAFDAGVAQVLRHFACSEPSDRDV